MNPGRLPRLAAAMLVAGATMHAQQPNQSASEVRQLFEAGRYEQVVEAARPETSPDPAIVFTAIQSHQKLGATDQAAALSRRLAELPDDNVWHFIGRSAEQLLADDTDGALASVDAALKIENRAEAHYQRGLVFVKRQAWRDAAMAFDRAADGDPMYAYAYYYGGLTHSRANRPDLMAVRFERFLKLAPEAPERPEVMQLMRTIRGR